MCEVLEEVRTKFCNRCHEEKELTSDYFFSDKSKKDGYNTICKVCIKNKVPIGTTLKQCSKCLKKYPRTETYFKESPVRTGWFYDVCCNCRNITNDEKSKLDLESGIRKCSKCHNDYPLTVEYFYENIDHICNFSFICIPCAKKKECKRSITDYENNTRICNQCSNSFPLTVEYFNTCSKTVSGLTGKCKTCTNNNTKNRKRKYTGKDDPKCIFKQLYDNIKQRCKQKDRICDFDKDYLQELWDNQQGKCAISDLQMTMIVNSGKVFTNVSVDRIDSKGNYTKDNVQLVCSTINLMKNAMPLQEFIDFCKLIANKYK